MIEQFVERIGKRKNVDIESWYPAKVMEMAHFFAKRIKEDSAALKTIGLKENKELEVLVK